MHHIARFVMGFIYLSHSKWFRPRSIITLSSVTVWVRVVLKRTVSDSD